MRARLFAKTGPFAGASFEIGAEASIGRTPDNQIVVPSELVSARHGRIAFNAQESCFLLEDLGSRNGTFLAGSRIRDPEKLGRLDVINFAGAGDFIFQVLADAALTPDPSPATAAPLPGRGAPPPGPSIPVPPSPRQGGEGSGTRVDREGAILPAALEAAAAEAGGGTMREAVADWVLPAEVAAEPAAEPVLTFSLRVEREEGAQTFDLPPGEHLVGRAPECAVSIDDRSLSRLHARLAVTASQVTLVDLGSTNGTYIADERIASEVSIVLAPGSEIHFAAVRATLILAERRTP